MYTNPFTDEHFAKLQIDTHKAKKIFQLNKNNFAYLFSLTQKLNMLYATCDSRNLKKIAKDNNCVYTLVESYEKVNNPTQNPIKQIVPRHTVILDLKLKEEDILAKMHPKGRYNIKLAQKKGVTIQESSDISDFYQILQETATRDGFAINAQSYYQLFLDHLGHENKAKLFMAYYEDKPIAGILNAYFNKTAIYYYGASSNQYRNLMAPYLLQWHGILDAKKNGYHHYDFLGVADPLNPKDPLQGVTYFKQKFGATPAEWPASKVIINQKFWFYLLKLKKFFKGIKFF